MSKSQGEKNNALVIEAFDTLFNRRDYAAAERFWSPHYLQHSAHIEQGRDGLFNLVKALPQGSRYETGRIFAEGDYVMAHCRFSSPGRTALIAADLLRIIDDVFVEHWDVLQEEATRGSSKSGLPMFGDKFPE